MVTTGIEWYRRYWLALPLLLAVLPLLLAVLPLLLAMLLALLAACGQQVGNTPAHQRH